MTKVLKTLVFLCCVYPILEVSASPESDLFKAIQKGDTKVVNRLIQEKKPDLNKEKNRCRSHRNSRYLQVDESEKACTPLMFAIESQRYPIASILLDNGANPNKMVAGRTALANAIREFQCFRSTEEKTLMLVESMLKKGADPNLGNPNKKPICLAADTSKINVILQLLNAGADPDPGCKVSSGSKSSNYCFGYSSDIPVEVIVNLGNVDLFKSIRSKVHFDQGLVNRLLKLAIRAKSVEIVRDLLEMGADPNSKPSYDAVPIVQAFRADQFEIFQTLFKAGANLNIEADFTSQSLAHAIFKSKKQEWLEFIFRSESLDLDFSYKLLDERIRLRDSQDQAYRNRLKDYERDLLNRLRSQVISYLKAEQVDFNQLTAYFKEGQKKLSREAYRKFSLSIIRQLMNNYDLVAHRAVLFKLLRYIIAEENLASEKAHKILLMEKSRDLFLADFPDETIEQKSKRYKKALKYAFASREAMDIEFVERITRSWLNGGLHGTCPHLKLNNKPSIGLICQLMEYIVQLKTSSPLAPLPLPNEEPSHPQ